MISIKNISRTALVTFIFAALVVPNQSQAGPFDKLKKKVKEAKEVKEVYDAIVNDSDTEEEENNKTPQHTDVPSSSTVEMDGAPSVADDPHTGEVEVISASPATGWSFGEPISSPIEYSNIQAEFGSKQILISHDSPFGVAVVSMEGSRYQVSFRGQVYKGFDTVEVNDRNGTFRGYGFSKAGDHFGFVATKFGKAYYIVDGEEESFREVRADQAHRLGEIIFSDDGSSYAYKINRGPLIVDGKVRVEDSTNISNLSFVDGTNNLRYIEAVLSSGYAKTTMYRVVVGDQEYLTDKFVKNNPRFLYGSIPAWTSSGDTNEIPTLFVGNEEIGQAVLVNMSDDKKTKKQPEGLLVAKLIDSVSGENIVKGIYVWDKGNVAVYPISNEFGPLNSSSIRRVKVSSAATAIAYEVSVNSRVYVVSGDKVSYSYEKIDDFDLLQNGTSIAVGKQGGKSFVVIDSVESLNINTDELKELAIPSDGNRFGVIRRLSYDVYAVDQERKAHSQFSIKKTPNESPSNPQMSSDGSRVVHTERNGDRVTLFVNNEPYSSVQITPKSYEARQPLNFEMNENGSVLIWHTRGRFNTTVEVMINNMLVGPINGMKSLEMDGRGNIAFVTTRGKDSQQNEKMERYLYINGKFYSGINQYDRGRWIDGVYHCTGGRSTGDGKYELFTATFSPS